VARSHGRAQRGYARRRLSQEPTERLKYDINGRMKKRVCVFCGSYTGSRPIYRETALKVGQLLAQNGYGLVYGGGHVGLMGAVADGAIKAGGHVTGIIPKALFEVELGHEGITELKIVDSMHERKAMMANLSDMFIALPGGFGTFEEFFEVVTWSQLGVHRKPSGLLNVDGYYDGLLAMCDHAVTQGFLRDVDRALIVSHSDPEQLINTLSTIVVPESTKWLSFKQT
jgi:uncharacterized protein (TIGR00730 family)